MLERVGAENGPPLQMGRIRLPLLEAECLDMCKLWIRVGEQVADVLLRC